MKYQPHYTYFEQVTQRQTFLYKNISYEKNSFFQVRALLFALATQSYCPLGNYSVLQYVHFPACLQISCYNSCCAMDVKCLLNDIKRFCVILSAWYEMGTMFIVISQNYFIFHCCLGTISYINDMNTPPFIYKVVLLKYFFSLEITMHQEKLLRNKLFCTAGTILTKYRRKPITIPSLTDHKKD